MVSVLTDYGSPLGACTSCTHVQHTTHDDGIARSLTCGHLFCKSCLLIYCGHKMDAYTDIRPDYIARYDYISRPPVMPQDVRNLWPQIRLHEDMSEDQLRTAGIGLDHIKRYEDFTAKLERYIRFLDQEEAGPLYTCPFCSAPVSFIIIVMYVRP